MSTIDVSRVLTTGQAFAPLRPRSETACAICVFTAFTDSSRTNQGRMRVSQGREPRMSQTRRNGKKKQADGDGTRLVPCNGAIVKIKGYRYRTFYRLNLVRSFSILDFHSHDSASSPSLPARPMPLSTLRNLRVHRGCLEISNTSANLILIDCVSSATSFLGAFIAVGL